MSQPVVETPTSLSPLLVLAPFGRDSALACALFAARGVAAHACGNIAELCARLAEQPAALLISEEALGDGNASRLAQALRGQPECRALPVFVLARPGAGNTFEGPLLHLFEHCGHITPVPRPIRSGVLAALVGAAMRAHAQARASAASTAETSRVAASPGDGDLRGEVAALKAADQRKDEVLAILAHELRHPLAPIQNALHVLKIQPDPPNPGHYRWATDVIGRQVQHIRRLVDDLLDMARSAHDRIVLRKEPLELANVVKQALEGVQPLAAARRQALVYSAPLEPVRLEADPMRLLQVIGNLLSNASRYTPIGGHIRVAVQQEDTQAVVTITDDGIGIPREALNAIFEPFRQAGRPPDSARSGLGLGLALARRLIELHGGTITAESAGAGRGSTFTVRLPALARTAASDEAIYSRALGVAPGRRIVVLGDASAETFAVMLSEMGHEARATHSAVASLQAVQSFDPQLIFVDLDMREIDGCRIAEALRGASNREDLRLVAMTREDDPEQRRRTAAAGFAAYLLKPITAEVLTTLFDSFFAAADSL